MRAVSKAIFRFAGVLLLGVCGIWSLGLARPVEPTLVIENITVIDGIHGPRTGLSIVVRGDRIAKVGIASSVRAPRGAQVIDGRGRYAIPGLWDAHVHLTYNPKLGVDTSYPLFIANGVTSVRDMGGPLNKVLAAREAARAPGAIAPRVFIAGPLVDGPKPLFPALAVTIGSAKEARAQIDSLKAAGVDFIKLYEMLAPDVFVAALRRAHERGLPVAAHVPLDMDVIEAAAAGLDSMEHLRMLEMSCAKNWRELLAERLSTLATGPNEAYDRVPRLSAVTGTSLYARQRIEAIRMQDGVRCEKVIAALAAAHVYQTPNLTNTTDRTRPVPSLEWRGSLEYLPAAVRKDWLSGTSDADQSDVLPTDLAYAAWAKAMVVNLERHGVRMMAGTDSPSHHLAPGFSLHEEMALLVQAGLTPLEALTAATLRPAEFMHLRGKLGSIDKGKWADIVLLATNPLDDIRNIKDIDAVIKDGHLYDRGTLDSILIALRARNAQ